MLAEVISQRNQALNRCAALAGDLALANAEIEELKKLIQSQESK